MFGKIFSSIYDGTLADNWQALITFQQMIVLCDQDGVLDMTPEAISRRTGIPLEHIKAGIAVLESPDLQSRTKGEEGRRIVPIDDRGWGWLIVNHQKYRDLRNSQDRREYMREYMKGYREQKKSKQESLHNVNSKQLLTQLANTDTEADTDTKYISLGTSGEVPPCPHQEIINLYHEILPMCRRVKVWSDKRKKYLGSRWREDKERQNLGWWKEYFEYVKTSPFLVGNATNFQADLEWLVRPENLVKVIEGKYEGNAA